MKRWEELNPYSDIDYSDKNDINCSFKIGILKEMSHHHKYYIAACLEMGVPFRVIDIYANDWIDRIVKSECKIFLVWPSGNLTIWKEMFDERLYILVNELGYSIFPSLKEIWLYENKRRCRDWLTVNKIPIPETWIFFDQRDAFEFSGNCNFPIVFKTNLGASSVGVKIVKTRFELKKLIKRSFVNGIIAGRDARDYQWGYIILQEYLDDVDEWRMVRIGDSFFGHKKGKKGDFHSGSGLVEWEDPGEFLLTALYEITEAGDFRSMCVDIFQTSQNRLLVNEIQTVFGSSYAVNQLQIDGKPGRYKLDSENKWVFEKGDFSRNACANARLDYVIQSKLLNNQDTN